MSEPTLQELSNEIRKQLRSAITSSFSDFTDLEIFLEDELLDIELVEISSDKENMRNVIQALLKWLKTSGKYPKFIKALFKERSQNSEVQKLQALIAHQKKATPTPFLPPTSNCICPELMDLLKNWDLQKLGYLDTSFQNTFDQTYRYRDGFPYKPPLTDLQTFLDQLRTWSNPEFFVNFIKKLRKGCDSWMDTEGLARLETLGKQIAEKHSITWDEPINRAVEEPLAMQGYLLVALRPTGGQSKDQKKFTVWPELWLEQGTEAIEFENNKMVCTFEQVADALAKLIAEAEMILSNYESTEVVVEVFLPCDYLERKILSEWKVTNALKNRVSLGLHRSVMVRSLDRITLQKVWHNGFKKGWEKLQEDISQQQTDRNFYTPEKITTEPGELTVLLRDKTGLALTLALPHEAEERKSILSDVVNAPLPLAFWFRDIAKEPEAQTKALDIIHRILKKSCPPTSFATLAQTWQKERVENRDDLLVQNLCLLADHPVRRPKCTINKDPANPESDLMVAA